MRAVRSGCTSTGSPCNLNPESVNIPKPPSRVTALRSRRVPRVLGLSYFRVFQHRGWYYAIGMPGVFYRSVDGLADFEPGPQFFTKDMRHCAVHVKENVLHVLFSNAGDSPERILHATLDLQPDWRSWRVSEPRVVLEPQMAYEGVDLPLEPSVRGWAPEPVRQLRDPCVFEEHGKLYLLYSVAGEHGIALARLTGL